MALRQISLLVTASVLTGLVTGCASVGPVGQNPYAAAEYAGAGRHLYEDAQVSPLLAPYQVDSETGAPLELTAFVGIDGARRAHQLYGREIAEKLDGKCEPRVQVAALETLAAISDYCDVAISELVSFNTQIANANLLRPGSIVGIPGGVGLEGNPDALGLAQDIARQSVSAQNATRVYEARPGESIDLIAYKFDVSVNAIAAANPQIGDWSKIGKGEQIYLPDAPSAARAPQAQSDAGWQSVPVVRASATAPAPAWEGYGEGARGVRAVGESSVTALMPYRLKPVDPAGMGRTVDVTPRLMVDRTVAKPGGRIVVSVPYLPAGTDVTFYRGKSTEGMKAPRTVRVGPDGVATQTYVIPKRNSDAGGVVFKATRGDTGETYYSERVGVLKLGENAPKPANRDADDEDAGSDEQD